MDRDLVALITPLLAEGPGPADAAMRAEIAKLREALANHKRDTDAMGSMLLKVVVMVFALGFYVMCATS